MNADGWPTLDPRALRGLAGDIVRGLEPHTEADPAALLFSFLAMFGNACGRGAFMRVGTDEHPARFDIAIVGDSAYARKGTATSNTAAVMRAAAPDWADRMIGGFGSGEALVEAARHADHRVFVREPEFARILRVCQRDGQTLSPIVRQAWDGTRLQLRTRKETIVADGANVSILADITREELERVLTEVETLNGFANRFIFVMVRRSKLLPSGGNLDDEIVQHFAARVRPILRDAHTVGRMHRTPAADDAWHALYRRLAQPIYGMVGSVLARRDVNALRLSVVYALLDGSSKIDAEHIGAAEAAIAYAEDSAQIIFGSATGNVVADQILRSLRAQPDGVGLDAAEQHALFGGHCTAAELRAAHDLLAELGLAETVTQPTGGRPRTITFLC